MGNPVDDRISAKAIPLPAETPRKPLEESPRLAFGKVAERARVRRPVLGVHNRFQVPRGTQEP